MLKVLSRDTPNATGTGADFIPDPWELPTPAVEPQIPKTWQVSSESHPLISAVESPEALISGTTANSEQVILQDWLKLKAEKSKKLARQIGEALGLLYWIDYGVA